MPPIRTIPPAKAVKTERTHEENQERAYIAASRRSDRSLEARVESARRASEIHKRRTGRSLRVTEQDVINEEMYEEEDDDLPAPYRRLTAHLQTGSVDFNRRLAAYLTNQVAMRSAMEQMVTQSFAQHYPNAPQFPHNQQFPSPMVNTNISPEMTRPSPTTASSYRAAPYPSPHSPAFRQLHGRAYSTAGPSPMGQSGTPAGSPGASMPNHPQRRMSMPAQGPQSASATPALSTDKITPPDPDQQRQTQSATVPNKQQAGFPPLWQDMSPFTTSLPPESQQMLGPALDPNDPFTSMLMGGSDTFNSNPSYPWDATMSQPIKSEHSPMHPSWNGMSATLAPSALDGAVNDLSHSTKETAPLSAGPMPPPSDGFDFNLSQESASSKGMPQASAAMMSRQNSGQGLKSAPITPGEGFWDSYLQDGSWGEETGTA
ncbi:MAG: hypothetical protein Q9227_007930 [Pyrenula ochraceoflavens]